MMESPVLLPVLNMVLSLSAEMNAMEVIEDKFISSSESAILHDQLFDIVACIVETDKRTRLILKQVHAEHSFTSFFETFDIHVHPDLPHVMAADEPPPIDFFFDIPSSADSDDLVLKQRFVIYALTMIKAGHKSHLSIGSGSSTLEGSKNRVGALSERLDQIFLEMDEEKS